MRFAWVLLVMGCLVLVNAPSARAQPRSDGEAALWPLLVSSFVEAAQEPIATSAAALGRPLVLISHGPLRRAYGTSWVMDLVVSDGAHEVRLAMFADARLPPRRASDWRPSPFFATHLREAFALRHLEAWLAAHPDLRAFERRSHGGGAWAVRMVEGGRTTLCIDRIHPHAPQIAGCWREPGEVDVLLPEDFDHEESGLALRGTYRARIRGRERVVSLTLRLDGTATRTIGRRRARAEPATPTLGPLAFLEGRLEADGTMELTGGIERRRCMHTDTSWTCEPVRPAARPE